MHAGSASHSGRLFSLGIISDVQYADIPDGRSFKGVPRYYREALPALQRAVAAWRVSGVSFAMHFGAPACLQSGQQAAPLLLPTRAMHASEAQSTSHFLG